MKREREREREIERERERERESILRHPFSTQTREAGKGG